jgi:hypothetical protein
MPDEWQHFTADALGVPLVEIDADGTRADVDALDSERDDLAQPLGAVFRSACDREVVDQLVSSRLAWVEVDLAWPAAFDALDTSTRGSRYTDSIVSTAFR